MITRPPKLRDPEEVKRLVSEYFQEREKQKEIRELKNGDKRIYKTPPSILGLCEKLDISHDSFYRYIDENSENYNKEICDVLLRARDRISQELIEGMQQGFWNERITLAQLAKYGYLNNDSEEKTIKIVMQGNNDWSK